jgi:hypothetical protein
MGLSYGSPISLWLPAKILRLGLGPPFNLHLTCSRKSLWWCWSWWYHPTLPSNQNHIPNMLIGSTFGCLSAHKGRPLTSLGSNSREVCFRKMENENMVSLHVLVRAILTLQWIYHITSVDLQEEVLKKIVSLLRPNLLAGDRRKMQGKLGNFFAAQLSLAALVSSTLTCFPIATTLRLRCVWKWVDETKTWVGLGNPCSDMIGSSLRQPRWLRLGMEKSRKFGTPLVLMEFSQRTSRKTFTPSLKEKKCLVRKALGNNFLGQPNTHSNRLWYGACQTICHAMGVYLQYWT